MNHTPGPWKSGGGYIGTDEPDSQTIAYCSDHRNRALRSAAEAEANAYLIAAAPALLAENAILKTQVQKMREMLKRQEWSDGTHPAFFCYACNRHKTLGHRDDCELAILIKEAE